MLARPCAAQSARPADTAPLALFPIRTEWTLALNNLLTAPPVYLGSQAFFPIEGDRLVAYDLNRGTQLWIASISTMTEPAAGDGLVFVVEPTALTAIRAGDGTVAWQIPTPGTLVVPPVWDNGRLVVAIDSGDVLAFRSIDGSLVWRRNLGSPLHARPSLSVDRVDVALEDSRIVSLRIETGDPIWERKLGGPATALMAADNRIYAGSSDNFFYALEGEDGRIAWRWRTGADVVGVPVVDERYVYFVSLDNVLRALSRKSGVQHWARPLPIRPTRGPLAIARSLVVSGIAPTLRLYNAADGKPAGEVAAAGELAAPPYSGSSATAGLPQVLVITHDVARGTIATLFSRQIDPPLSPPAALPGTSKPVALEP